MIAGGNAFHLTAYAFQLSAPTCYPNDRIEQISEVRDGQLEA
jgi:hypothetical protein